MPVLFRGRSEYKRNYRWNPSFRSASFEPRLNQNENDAGIRSDQVFSSQEPSFTIKKKVWHRDPQVQSCLMWWPESDTEEKNGNAIKQTKKDASPLVKAEKQRKSSTTRKSPKIKPSGHVRSQSLDGSVILVSNKDDRRGKVVLAPSSSHKKSMQTEDLKLGKGDGRYSSKKEVSPQKKKSLSSSTAEAKRYSTSKRLVKSDTRSPEVKEYRSRLTSSPGKREIYDSPKQSVLDPKKSKTVRGSTGEITRKPDARSSRQSSPEKREISKLQKQGTKDSKKSKQSEENIPLKLRAGLQANKLSRTSKARLSEYQRNFTPPKFRVKQSPLLSALDVVHQSSPAIPPHGGIKFRPTTEYVANFKVRESPLMYKPSQTSPASPSMKARVRDLQNPQKPFFTHATKKDLQSEYAAQYEAIKESQAEELRQLAESNKQKHLGTHIDPNHATQVASPYNKCWEASSNGSGARSEQKESEVNENNLKELEKDAEDNWSKASQIGSDHTESLDTEIIEVDSLEDDASSATRDSVARKLAWSEVDEEDKQESVATDEKSESSVTKSQSILEGRVTTPRLQSMGGARRSHLDLTTPSKGGALLVSPSRHDSSTGSFVSAEHLEENTPPIAGAPTFDAQNLLKDRAHTLTRSSQRCAPEKSFISKRPQTSPAKTPVIKKESTPMKKTTPISSPAITRHVSSLRNVRAPIRGALRSEEFQHCGPLGKLHTAPASAAPRDDDALSVASSLTSARASELLQRAKERKSFWTTA